MPDCCMRKRVFEEGDVTRAAAVATCAQVLMHVVGLVGGTALRSCDACHLCWQLCLDASATNVVGLLLDLAMVAMRGALTGLTFDCRNICGHPQNWCLQLRGAHGLSVVIVMGYGDACWCLHSWNLLRVAM
jgi:hypothetical protein